MGKKPYQERSEYQAGYQCPTCLANHPTEKGARDCCKEEIPRIYICEHCEREYDHWLKARDCCSYWVCEICDREYDTKQEAKNCCHEEEQ